MAARMAVVVAALARWREVTRTKLPGRWAGRGAGSASSTERRADRAEPGAGYWDRTRREQAQPAPMPVVDVGRSAPRADAHPRQPLPAAPPDAS